MEAEMAGESYSDCEEEECLIQISLIDDTFAAEYRFKASFMYDSYYPAFKEKSTL